MAILLARSVVIDGILHIPNLFIYTDHIILNTIFLLYKKKSLKHLFNVLSQIMYYYF